MARSPPWAPAPSGQQAYNLPASRRHVCYHVHLFLPLPHRLSSIHTAILINERKFCVSYTRVSDFRGHSEIKSLHWYLSQDHELLIIGKHPSQTESHAEITLKRHCTRFMISDEPASASVSPGHRYTCHMRFCRISSDKYPLHRPTPIVPFEHIHRVLLHLGTPQSALN